MKTPKEFDYDLWTTDEGKCFVRVKLSGEVSEVSPEVMRLLRADEKRLRRETTPVHNKTELGAYALQTYEIKHPSALAYICIVDNGTDVSEKVVSKIQCQLFESLLTPNQREAFKCCILGGEKKSEYAKSRGISPASVTKVIKQIREAAKKFWFEG